MIKLLPGLLLAVGAPTKGVGYLFLGLALLALAWARMGKGGEGCKGCTL